MQAINTDQAVNSPVEVTISGVDYPNSFTQDAAGDSGTTTVWDAAGFSSFTAEVGINDSTSASGQTARVTFLNQDSVQLASVKVSIGHPVNVRFKLNGAVNLQITCLTPSFLISYAVSFGNAQFIP